MKLLKWLLRDERGAVEWIVPYFGLFIVMSICGMILIDVVTVHSIDRQATEMVDELNRDIYQLLDVEYSAFTTGFQLTDDDAAFELFTAGLQSRLHLDSSMEPTGRSMAHGAVVIRNWKMVHEADLPVSDSNGRTMMYPGIITEIEFPIRTPMFSLNATKRILVTTEIYR